MNQYRIINEDTSGNPVYVAINGKIYNSIFTFKESVPINKKRTYFFEMRIVCKEEKCNRYELLFKECLDIYKKIFHGDQQFNDGHSPIEYCWMKENAKDKI